MTNKTYIFLWKLSTGWTKEGFKDEAKVPIPACGSDNVILIDGRWSIETVRYNAERYAIERGAIGYSVGRLTCHDPEDKHIQSRIKFTSI